jgi:hypothetical protein
MREARSGQRNIILGQALDVGRVWSVWRGIPDRRPNRVPRRWKRRLDGVEIVLVQGVRHTCRPTVRRENIDGLQ